MDGDKEKQQINMNEHFQDNSIPDREISLNKRLWGNEKLWNFLCYPALFLTVLALCWQCDSHPFSHRIPYVDSAVFMTIGRGMEYGKIPYVDFFDHKGLLLYFINYAGMKFGGVLTIWGFQVFILFIAVFFTFKTALLLVKEKISVLIGTCSALILFFNFMAENNTEIYVQPFIAISLFLFSRHLLGRKELCSWEIFIIGCCCGATLMLKPNLVFPWFAFGGVTAIHALKNKKIYFFTKLVFFYISGIAFFLLPCFIYLVRNNAVESFWEQYILFNQIYCATVSSPYDYVENFLHHFFSRKSYLILGVVFAHLIFQRRTVRKTFFSAYLLSLFSGLIFISYSSNNTPIYTLAFMVLYIPAMVLFVDLLFIIFYRKKGNIILLFVLRQGWKIIGKLISKAVVAYSPEKRKCQRAVGNSIAISLLPHSKSRLSKVSSGLCIVGILGLILFSDIGVIIYGSRLEMSKWESKAALKNGEFGLRELERVCETIKNNSSESDEIIVLANQCQFYLSAQRNPATKYLYSIPAYHSQKILMEYQQLIIEKRPMLVVIPPANYKVAINAAMISRLKEQFPLMFQFLETEYSPIFDTQNTAIIYKRK